MGRYGNPKSHSYNWSYNEEEYQNFTVEVLDAQFIVPIELKYEKKYNRYGTYTVSKKNEDYKPPKKSKYKREQISTSYDCKYEGMWVIGTDYIFNYGKAPNQKRSETNFSEVKLDYTIYAPDLYDMENKSLIERIIGFADELQIISLKIQQMIMKMRPKGAAIEVGSLEGVDNGKGGTFTPLDLAEIYDQTGNYYYRSIDEEGNPSSARPITELDGGVGSALGELLNMYNHYVNQIRDATGINEAMDATTPNSKALVGVQKLSIMAANNAIRFINDAYLDIYERTAICVAKAIQAVVKYDKPLKGFVKAIGQSNMKVIEVGKEVGLHEFGLKIESLPDEVEKQQLDADVQISLDRQEIQIEDAIMIRKISNVKLAVQMLILKRRQYREQQTAEAERRSKAEADEQIRVAQEKAQLEAQSAELEATQKIRVLEAEYKFKMMLAQEMANADQGSPDRFGRANPNDMRL
jgi:hypothetical protein